MNEKLLISLEKQAILNKVPILRPNSFKLLLEYLEKYNCRTVLEIGSAVGITAFRLSKEGYRVTSIEKNDSLYQECLENQKKLQSDVCFILGDGKAYEFNCQFDCCFIDGGKAHYQAFFDNCFKTNPQVIFIDNTNFGLKDKMNYPERLHPICDKMKNFISNLRQQSSYQMFIHNIEDGVIVLVKK